MECVDISDVCTHVVEAFVSVANSITLNSSHSEFARAMILSSLSNHWQF